MWSKEQYKAYKAAAYRRCKEWCQGPWWFQQQEPIVKFTGWLAFLTFTLAVVAALQFCVLQQTNRTMQDQLSEMQGEQRPWIFLKIEPTGRLAYYENGQTQIETKWTFQNVGKTPGRHVFVVSETMSPDRFGFYLVKERQKIVCQREAAANDPRFTVFPGEPVVQSHLIHDDKPDVRLNYPLPGGKGIRPFFFFGCVRYQLASGEGRYHDSPFIYSVGPTGPHGPEQFPFIALTKSSDGSKWTADPPELLFEPNYNGTADIN